MVRNATLDDIVKLLPLVQEFSRYIGLEQYYDNKSAARTLAECINHGICIIDDEQRGVIAGSTTQSPWNSHVLVLHEHIYFVKRIHRNGTLGGRLLREYDRQSKQWEVNSLKLMHY